MPTPQGCGGFAGSDAGNELAAGLGGAARVSHPARVNWGRKGGAIIPRPAGLPGVP